MAGSVLAARKEELHQSVKDITFNQWSASSCPVEMPKRAEDVPGRCLTLVNYVLSAANQWLIFIPSIYNVMIAANSFHSWWFI